MPGPDLSDATVRGLLELADRVRAAKPRSATSYLSVLSPDMAAAVLRDLLETREALRRVVALAEGYPAGPEAALALEQARKVLERGELRR